MVKKWCNRWKPSCENEVNIWVLLREKKDKIPQKYVNALDI